MAARSLYLKCSLLADSQGGRNGPEFTSVNTLLVNAPHRKLDHLQPRSLRVCAHKSLMCLQNFT